MIEEVSDGLHLLVYVQPGARKSEIIGLHNGALKIKIAAPPVDGLANEALLDFIQELTSLPSKKITLISGMKSRMKKVHIAGWKRSQLESVLGNVGS